MPRPIRGLLALLALSSTACAAGPLQFDRIVIDDNFPGAYQVEVADVNGDGKPDIIALGGGTCAWYENPGWTKRLVSTPKNTPGIITSATRDIDGDGKAEIAIGYEFAMNEPRKGKLLLARQKGDDWTYTQVADVPSVHRLRWGDFDGDNHPDLAVAPIFGANATPPLFQESPAQPFLYRTGGRLDPATWRRVDLEGERVLHAIDVPPVRAPGEHTMIFAASNRGVARLHLQMVGEKAQAVSWLVARGAEGTPPKVGCSEVHTGRTKARGWFLVTVDPWHGSEVALRYAEEPGTDNLMFDHRIVIDTTLKDGHALWTADVDGDGDDEILAGYRGPGTSVIAYDYNSETKHWDRTVVDAKIAAQDLRGGDLDGDGTPDVVAVGGSTHNVVWYRPNK